jgi:hypothetical protein
MGLVALFFAPSVLFIAVMVVARFVLPALRARREPPALAPGQVWHGMYTRLMIHRREGELLVVDLEMWLGDGSTTVCDRMSEASVRAHIEDDAMILVQPSTQELFYGQKATA